MIGVYKDSGFPLLPPSLRAHLCVCCQAGRCVRAPVSVCATQCARVSYASAIQAYTPFSMGWSFCRPRPQRRMFAYRCRIERFPTTVFAEVRRLTGAVGSRGQAGGST